MLDCTTEQAWVVYRWTFDKMLPQLPGPGTNPFATLARDLQPYGISPAGISIDAPTTTLGDVNLRFLLLEDERGVLRISYGFFELAIGYFSDGDDKAFAAIVGAVFRALLELDKDSKQGRSQVTFRAHLKLGAGDPEGFLRALLNPGTLQEDLVPNVLSYKVNLGGNSQASGMQIGVTKSMRFDKGLFVELVADYTIPADTEKAGEQFTEDARTALSLVGLNLAANVKSGE